MGIGRDLFLSEPAELVADHAQGFVQAGVAERAGGQAVLHQFGNAGAHRLGVAAAHQRAHCRVVGEGGDLLVRGAHLGRASPFHLAHLKPADQLGAVFAEAGLQDQRLQFAAAAFGIERLLPCQRLA